MRSSMTRVSADAQGAAVVLNLAFSKPDDMRDMAAVLQRHTQRLLMLTEFALLLIFENEPDAAEVGLDLDFWHQSQNRKNK